MIVPVAGASIGEVGEDLLLGIEPDRGVDKPPEVDAIAVTAEAQRDAFVLMAFAQDAIRDALVHEHPDRPLLEDARPIGRLDLVA